MQVASPLSIPPSFTPPLYSSIHSFVLLQLLLTGVILAASATVASAAAARFWERHTAMQLLGIEAVLPDPRWTPAVALKPPFDSSKAAVDFAVGVFYGCTGATLHLLAEAYRLIATKYHQTPRTQVLLCVPWCLWPPRAWSGRAEALEMRHR